MISRSKKSQDESVVACDIVELFCENSNSSSDERMAYPRISSSTKLGEEMCATCKDCAVCQLQQQNRAAVRIRKSKRVLMSDQNEELVEHLDYYESDVDNLEMASTSNAVISIEHGKGPILVDLTSEESKQATWKQTILKQINNTEESSEMSSENVIMSKSEPRIMIADSSCRVQRSGTGSLATALRDRGPCVIPVQPNRSLPIRPAPPTPTRSTSIITLRKIRSPILKLSKSMNVDVVKLQAPSGSLTNQLNEISFEQQNENGDEMMFTNSELIDRSDYILPDMSNVVQIRKEVNGVKRNNDDDYDKEYNKEIAKDVKRRRKSHEIDNDYLRDERVKNILKEYSKTYSNNSTDKGVRKSQQHVMVRLWDNKRYSSPVVMSTTQAKLEKTDTCNKVPPLRLKKVVRETNTVDEYQRDTNHENTEGNESNYRIVTGATPRPESPSADSFWSSVASGKEFELSMGSMRDKSRRSSPKSDGYKIKYRRNRLLQKLRELRSKALKLSREMTACNNTADTSPQRSTRLRQMMNCYEKQIENISKLLCKLSASIPPTTDDVVDLDYENELEHAPIEKTAVDSNVEQINGISRNSVSPSLSSSPEPPKLSPRSPIDYEKGKSPDAVRDSPPVLPRVYIAIQPTTLECLKQNLTAAKSWHKDDNSSSSSSSPSSPIEKEIKVNDTDQTIISDDVTAAPVISAVSSSEFKELRNNTAEWEEETSLELKNSEIEENISEDTKTFSDIKEHRLITPTISSDSFLSLTIDTEIDGSNMRDTKERPVAQRHLDEVIETSETVMDKQIVCEKQEHEQKSNEALPSIPIEDEARKLTEYETYNSEDRISSKNRIVTSTVTATQETPTTIGRPPVPAANVTNILQLQSNYYGSSAPSENVFTDVIQNSKDVQKVTSSMNQSTALDPAIPLGFTSQSRSAVSSSNQQCIVLPNSNNATRDNTYQRNDGSRIMTEQFPTLGNWVARMSKKHATKSKSKLPSGINLPTASTAEAARIPGVEAQKVRSNASNNVTRNNIVNVAPQWNTERWQRQQHQQRQQQLYTTASSTAPPVRPGICPPISVTQFYPPNYAIDPYGSAGFGYHSTICPYGDYPYHSRLHATAPSISGYQIGSLQDPHASPLRPMQHLDKRYPAHLQDTASRHFATDLLKYPGALSASGYQHAAAAAAAGLDYDRLRTATAATQNGSAPACLPPLLLPPPSLAASAQQSLARTSVAGYPAGNGQCGRNRMIPDVVAAAAAAAVVAAASFGRQRGTLPYGRNDTELVSGGIGGVIDNESSQLMAPNRVANREHLSQEQVQSVGAVNVESRVNNGGYRQLQNLILDRLPYVKGDDAYSQSQTAIFDDSTQESTVASSVPKSTYKSTTNNVKDSTRKENRSCETPNLGKVNRTLETASILECSNCGLVGSMFKCLGCETAFYCDERCQTRHWSIHVEKCPKRMPKLKKLV
ncbi:hypothetical protein PUN28_016467 [Cardiocondyla obscurior]|uniref:MYND-type domain-containing protein n=1 Tax=Cardiocondyla obscurior TaxID=286306 RepID=A0AAW2ENW7_9HYME